MGIDGASDFERTQVAQTMQMDCPILVALSYCEVRKAFARGCIAEEGLYLLSNDIGIIAVN